MLQMQLGDRSKILLVCAICVMFIVVYGTIRCKGTFVDPLTFSPLGPPWNTFVDGWGLTHFFFYMALGYFFPHKLLFITVLGVAWEAVEMAFKEHPFYLSKCDYTKSTPGEGYENWWTGRWQDLVNNTLGMLLGAWLAAGRTGMKWGF